MLLSVVKSVTVWLCVCAGGTVHYCEDDVGSGAHKSTVLSCLFLSSLHIVAATAAASLPTACRSEYHTHILPHSVQYTQYSVQYCLSHFQRYSFGYHDTPREPQARRSIQRPSPLRTVTLHPTVQTNCVVLRTRHPWMLRYLMHHTSLDVCDLY